MSSTAPPAIQASLRAPAPQITGPPHVRGALDVPGAMRCVIVAALPCVGMAIYNAGYQARSASSAGLANAGDWRLGAFEALGVPATSTQTWVCVAHGAAILLPLLVAALLAGGLAERLFAHFRQRDVDHTALGVIALLFTLCLPPSIPLWQAALGGFIAVAVGKEIFGGFGLNFVNPPLVGLAFLYFTYPAALSGGYGSATPLAAAQLGGLAGLDAAGWTWLEVLLGRVPGALGETSALACTLGLAVLLYTGVASWRVVAGGALGLVASALLIDSAGSTRPIAGLPWYWHAVTDGFAFGLVFLATDPVTAPVTNSARWLYGLLIGSLAVLLRVANPAQSESVLLAVLLGNVMAPLLDQIAARTQLWRRSRADGR